MTHTKLGSSSKNWAIILCCIAVLALQGCMSSAADANEKGQCWSMKGGVGVLKKNSATRAECEKLGGKSWCHFAGACEDL
ncbi:hypothetical protein QX776_01085 [Alteromonadaceae bacterium BrNp21-10]|nr:hypothetical protein [Alteromonadaceae bacterium BrNp21-10]